MTRRIAQPIPQLDRVSDLITAARADSARGRRKRARALRAKVLLKPHVNPAPGHREMWIQDPDGYVVVIASPDGEAR